MKYVLADCYGIDITLHIVEALSKEEAIVKFWDEIINLSGVANDILTDSVYIESEEKIPYLTIPCPEGTVRDIVEKMEELMDYETHFSEIKEVD